jgi:hypothetical protein
MKSGLIPGSSRNKGIRGDLPKGTIQKSGNRPKDQGGCCNDGGCNIF